MRKTIYIVLAALGLCLFAGCGSSDKEKVSPTANSSSASGSSRHGRARLRRISIPLVRSGQYFRDIPKARRGKIPEIHRRYQVQNDVLSGKYSGGRTSGSTYDISFNESGSTLTLTSATNVTEVSVYERSTIPNSVKEGAAVMKSTRSAVRLAL
ncbi:MAG: hypothetical protein ACLRMJ_04955 [Alistipes finegoldii]